MNSNPRELADIRLVGGRPSLDFVNTVHERYVEPREDYLRDGRQYLAWAQAAGVLDRAEAERIQAADGVTPGVMSEVRRLREHLHEIFVARIHERAPDAAALAALDQWVQRAWRGSTVVADGTAVQLAWRPEAIDAVLPLRRIALDALEIIRATPRERLKECASTRGCGWLFLDESKNNSRRWCCMDSCGTQEKMRRYRSAP
jgi:predicted RNA-binding Zn ribbon-like protein